MSKLDWRRSPRAALAGTTRVARKTAQGRFSGWWYELVKSIPFPGAEPIWHAWFHDDSVLNIDSRTPKSRQLGSGSYTQALKAVTNHHEHRGF